MAGRGEERDFRSKSFNPSLVLSSSNVTVPIVDATEYEDLNALRTVIHGQTLHGAREIPGVLGPGGVPIRRLAPVPTDRNFSADQGLIRGRGRRRQRNVLNRMEEMEGPLAVLRRCQEENIKVKVYTRNQCEIRGLVTGYVVAFDKHWNLALRDVDEIFQKKIRSKTPALGDVSGFISIGDLTIRGGEISSDSGSEGEESQMKGQGLWGEEARAEEEEEGSSRYRSERYGEGAVGGGPSSSSLSSSMRDQRMSSSRSRGLTHGRGEGWGRDEEGKGAIKKKKVEFRGAFSVDSLDQRARLSRPVSTEHPHTSEAQDALRLSLSRRKHEEQQDIGGGGSQHEEGEEGECQKKKRIRKRKTREIRKRHVNQLFIRGENVVLINVVEQ